MTTATTQTLADFLLARIEEDEAEAESYLAELQADPPSVYDMQQVGWIEAGSPERVLAECEAKRALVQDYKILDGDYRVTRDPMTEARRFQALVAVSRAAEVYSDHEDYRDDWRA